ncbi:MAG: H-type lectin domain-containing protein [Magnetococcales bacterium]|nr:H-type lectin domain-containing protein [Magnetococcales bacterium]
MNDPKQTFFKSDDKAVVTQTTKSTAIPATTKNAKTIDATTRSITKLAARVKELENQLAKFNSTQFTILKTAVGENSSIINDIQGEVATQQSQLSTLAKTEQLRVENGIILAEKGSKKWKLANMFSKKRNFSKRVNFTTPFKQPPKILLGITTIELLNEKTKLQAKTSKIDKSGFTITLETKSDSRVGEVSVDWAAFGG